MTSDRTPKAAFNYHPKENRDKELKRKIWIEAGTGLLPLSMFWKLINN